VTGTGTGPDLISLSSPSATTPPTTVGSDSVTISVIDVTSMIGSYTVVFTLPFSPDEPEPPSDPWDDDASAADAIGI
jgi:hypothetical protein